MSSFSSKLRLPKYLSPEQIEEAAVHVFEVAKKEDVSVALTAGAALMLYGSDRMVTRITFAATDTLKAYPDSELSPFGCTSETPNGVPFRLLVNDGRNLVFESEVVSLFRNAIADADCSSFAVPIVRPEYFAAIMMYAGPARARDLDALIVSGHLDLEKARKVIEKHLGRYAVRHFANIVAFARWQAEREEP